MAKNTIGVETSGIKYAGSKRKLIPYIIAIASEYNPSSVLDGFSGTTRVSQAFAKRNYTVTSVDISEWSYIIGRCFLQTKKPREYYQPLIDELNSLQGKTGWFTETYSHLNKSPFQTKNLMRLDSIRDKIDEWNLSEEDKAVILTSLILALDKVDNTLGHFSSYLSEWSPRSYNELYLEVPRYEIYDKPHRVIRDDIFNVITDNSFDLAYFDPPYGSNNKMPTSRVRYSVYYHFWTTVILNDKPDVFGVAGRRMLTEDSPFEEYHKDANGNYIATNSIKKLIGQTNAKYIVLSYSNNGRTTKEELMDILRSNGNIEQVVTINYKRNSMSAMRWTDEWINSNDKNIEYLFVISK